MRSDQVRVDTFSEFVTTNESGIRRALTSAFGSQTGRESAAEAFVYAWRNWDRVSVMDNPAGYIYRVGHNTGKRSKKPDVAPDFEEIADRVPWVEPGLGPALSRLSDQQRTVVALIHAFEWSMGEVAQLLGLSKATVQTHERRAMTALRKNLGVLR